MARPQNKEGKEMKKEQCAQCGGTLLHKTISYDKKVGAKRVLFEDVPALVCSDCDSVWMDGKVAEKMEEIFHNGKEPTRWATIPIWSLAKAA